MPRNDFTSAAEAIARECGGRWNSDVSRADTAGWVSADAIHDWINDQVGLRSPQSIIAELASRMTDAEAVSLLHAIGHDKDAVYGPFDKALDTLVTDRLIEAAEEIINDNHEPATSFASLERKLDGGVFGAIGLRP